MGGSDRSAFDKSDVRLPPDTDGGVSHLARAGLRIVEVSEDAPRVRAFILNEDGVVARIEQAEDGSLAWFGHWRGGTNAGTDETSDDVLQSVVRHYARTVERTPWRLLVWPSETISAV